ncbi:MAG: TonB-dependent receptor [Flavobacteriales bacterium]
MAFEPRISARYLLKDDLSVKASYAMMNQYLHLLSNTGVGLPTDLWVPATSKVRPQRSNQVAVGLAKDLSKPKLTITLEGYYKKMNNVVSYKEGASFLLVNAFGDAEQISWEDNVTQGVGELRC